MNNDDAPGILLVELTAQCMTVLRSAGLNVASIPVQWACPVGRVGVLTAFEQRVLQLIASGMTYKDIACELAISSSAVNAAMTRIRNKTLTNSRQDILQLAADLGM